jgi:hypothetical protein
MRLARGLLIAAGLGLAGYGAVLLLTTLSPWQLVALALWLAAVVVVHDGLLAPLTSALRVRWWRGAPQRPPLVTAIAQVGFVVGGVLTLFVVPELWAQGRGSANPTILVGDYAIRLLVVWAVIALAVLVAARLVIRRSRR